MTGNAMWSHLGGSGDFSSLLVSPRCDQMALRQMPLPPFHLFRNESQRPMVIQLVGQLEPRRWNVHSALAAKGVDAVPPYCQQCGGRAMDCMFAPCGHAVYCRACWEALPRKPVLCQLCMMPIDATCRLIDCAADGNSGICPICYATESDSVILPCGHEVCHQCGEQWVIANSTCPFCPTANPHVRWRVSYA
jgi:hypothetical protein